MKFFDLEQLMRKARDVKEKSTGDRYSEVTAIGYAGGPFQLSITLSGSDEGFEPKWYIRFIAEDDDFEFDTGMYSGLLRSSVKDYFSEYSDVSELNDEIEVENISEIEDLASGQLMLFESKKHLFSKLIKSDYHDPSVEIADSHVKEDARKAMAALENLYDNINPESGWSDDIRRFMYHVIGPIMAGKVNDGPAIVN